MEFIPYKSNECFEHSYYQIPMELFINSKYKDKLNSDSKLLYAFLLDRLSLSQKHNWIDEQNRIYLIFTRKEVQEKLCLSEKTVTKAFNQLAETNLISEKRQGLGKANLIYVGKIEHENIPNIKKEQLQTRKIYGSGAVENMVLEQEFFPTIKPNNINTNITNLILSNQDMIDEVNSYANIFKQNIEYEVLIADSNNADLLQNITDIAIDTLNTAKDFVYINSESKPTELVKSQLLKINPGHIEYVINCLKNNKNKIKNIKSYILTALYNSVNTMHLDSTLVASYIMNN